VVRAERNPERDVWVAAWVVALVLHLVAILIFRNLPAPRPPAPVHRIEPIRLVFARPATATSAATRKSHQPTAFTELPPDRADQAPKHADFLSNVTSQARDHATTPGDNALPQMKGEADVPMVKLQAAGSASQLAMPMPELRRPVSSTSPTPQSQQSAQAAKPQSGATSATTSPKSSAAAANPTVTDVTPRDGAGSSYIDQPDMNNPNGSAGLTGDVSLNTTAWNYAPWLERFGRELMHRWIPPPAYSMGILKEGGWAVIEVEISKSGEMLRLQVLEEQGHPSLSQAAQGALRSMAPIERLPADFPEQTLILRIRMIYPKIHPR
jgi:outer membrane biosynthesis protein TonB